MVRGMRDLTSTETDELLRLERVAHVAVIDGDTPYVGPLSYVYADGNIIFRTMEGRRLDALRQHPRVSLSVTRTGPGAADWSTVLVIGTAEIIADRSESSGYVAQIVAKYRAAYGVLDSMPEWMLDPAAHVVRIVPEEITGKAAGDTKPGRF
jgi:nitroimidazol reductase NimA-like FMN-containing flavoprotein (pyridoxamine 5'-phosphate oxidase superfamily)